jgi:hypothetical protein
MDGVLNEWLVFQKLRSAKLEKNQNYATSRFFRLLLGLLFYRLFYKSFFF